MALSKIEHFFPIINFTEDNLAELDKVLTSCLRKMFNIYTNTTVRTMFTKKQHGGLGIRKPSLVYKATRISFLVCMLNREDDNFDMLQETHFVLILKNVELKEQFKKETF